jgi:hypothetical protein
MSPEDEAQYLVSASPVGCMKAGDSFGIPHDDLACMSEPMPPSPKLAAAASNWGDLACEKASAREVLPGVLMLPAVGVLISDTSRSDAS